MRGKRRSFLRGRSLREGRVKVQREGVKGEFEGRGKDEE